MTELEIITTAAGGLAVLAAAIVARALSRGWVEGSVTLRVIPPWKRRAPGREAAQDGPASGGDPS